jgi:uncharacterized protein (DUF1800 family)
MKTRTAAGLGALLVVLSATSGNPDAAPAVPNDETTIVHVLNRIAFGPRPGDVERVRRMGLDRYIDEQLHPERIADTAVAQRLASLKTTSLTSREIVDQYARPALEARRERKQQMREADGTEPAERRPKAGQQGANLPLTELSQQKILRAVYSERQLEEVLVDFWFNHFNVDARKGPTASCSPNTSATRSARTCSDRSARCSKPRPRAPRCSFISTTG